MHSLISKDGEYIGQYLHLKNNEYCIQRFTKFYNITMGETKYFIKPKTVKDLLIMSKYNLQHNVYANDPETDEIILKPLKINSYIVYISKSNKLYIFTKSEFKKYINNNKYKLATSTNFILALQEDNIFKNIKSITTNNIDSAKKIYMKKYSNNIEPVVIGIEEDKYLYIPTDNGIIVSKIVENKDII